MFVNELYKQWTKYHNGDFYCYTDNPRGIDPGVKVVTFEPRHDERMWWNKTYLWQPGLFNNPTIFFDLDCVIHNNTNDIVDHSSKTKPNFLKTHWFSDDMARIIHHCNVNSSIMVFHDNNYQSLWDEYNRQTTKIFKTFNSYLYSLNDSKFFAGLVFIMLNIGSKYITLKFSKSQEAYLRLVLSRQLLIFSIATTRYLILLLTFNKKVKIDRII